MGSETDHKVIQTIMDQMTAAHAAQDPEREATLDAEFHMAIIEASHNVFLLHMVRSMFDMLKKGVFYNRQVMFNQPTTRTALLNQHHAICTAIQTRDGNAARAAVNTHMAYIKACMQDAQKAQANEAIAKLRLDHTVKQ
jgi:GntR family transcriptional repressor for pyruvate dehydrogenase complex